MGSQTCIAWTDHTFNPWRGCTKVSAGCANCYAEALSKRSPAVLGEWGPTGKRAIAAESYWRLPVQWNAAAKRDGVRRRVFCASLADVFEDRPELDAPRRSLFAAIAATPNLDWLLLTKRPENIVRLWPGTSVTDPPMVEMGGSRVFANLWLGVSVEDQATADARIPILLDTPAAVRFVSYEPALEAVDFSRFVARDGDFGHCIVCGWRGSTFACPTPGHGELRIGSLDRGLDWLIVGGESGPKARPFDVAWARSVVAQCKAAGVAFFYKQGGASNRCAHDRAGGCLDCIPADLRIREFPR